MTVKKLPNVFFQGYLDALIEILGYSMVKSAIREGFKGEVSQIELDKLIDRTPNVSYKQLRLIYFGLQIMLLNQPKVNTFDFTKHIGKIWWYPSSPLTSRYWRKNSLYDLSSEYILDSLVGYKEIENASTKMKLMLESFIIFLREKGNFEVNISFNDTSIRIELNEHPFHSDKVHDCAIFFGVIEGFIEWMYGFSPSQVRNGLSQLFQIDEKNSSSNRVEINIK